MIQRLLKSALFACVALGLGLSASTASAVAIPYNIGHITDWLDNPAYFHGYTQVDAKDFAGSWYFTAIASEAGNTNITEKNSGNPPPIFSNSYLGNWGQFEVVDFNSENLYFSDASDAVPLDAPLDPFPNPQNVGHFLLFQLTSASELLSYLANPITLPAGTIIVGFNDNAGIGDADYDDIVVAMNPVPEPTTMMLLGVGLASLAGLRRKKKV